MPLLWILYGHADPEAGLDGGEIVCELAPAEDGVRLIVTHNGDVVRHESYPDLTTAAGMAELARARLRESGWIDGDPGEG